MNDTTPKSPLQIKIAPRKHLSPVDSSFFIIPNIPDDHYAIPPNLLNLPVENPTPPAQENFNSSLSSSSSSSLSFDNPAPPTLENFNLINSTLSSTSSSSSSSLDNPDILNSNIVIPNSRSNFYEEIIGKRKKDEMFKGSKISPEVWKFSRTANPEQLSHIFDSNAISQSQQRENLMEEDDLGNVGDENPEELDKIRANQIQSGALILEISFRIIFLNFERFREI